MRCPFIIGVAGGTASGKSTVCSRIIDRLSLNGGQKRVVAISQDSFYRDLVNNEEFLRALRGDFNFDHPDAFEHTSMVQTLRNLKQYKPAQIPLYDFKTHSRIGWRDIDAADVILVEGILIFFDQAFEDFCLPTKKYADVIIPRGAENNVAIELIVQHIQDILRTPSPPNRSKSRESDENVSETMENNLKNSEKEMD
uniref:uridine/cytidine kinase n=1 Tax=Meloidogyne hapla TaxID=6305 RepID=A0A1I8BB19_MELHA